MLLDNGSLWLGFFHEIGGNPLFRYIKKISGTSDAKTLPQIDSATRLWCKIITLLLYHGSAKTIAQEKTQHAGSLANGRPKRNIPRDGNHICSQHHRRRDDTSHQHG